MHVKPLPRHFSIVFDMKTIMTTARMITRRSDIPNAAPSAATELPLMQV